MLKRYFSVRNLPVPLQSINEQNQQCSQEVKQICCILLCGLTIVVVSFQDSLLIN